MRITIKDVARDAGVSMNTVSRVLNDRPDVNPETRRRVQRTIETLGYRPNALARSLLQRRSRTIGHVVPNYANPNVARQLQAVQDTMTAAGYTVISFDTQERPATQRMALQALEEKVADGLIMTPVSSRDDALGRLSSRIPLVLTNREVLGLDVDRVVSDNILGARLAIEHLISLGHRTIGYITSDRQVSTVEDRLTGYRQALEAADLPVEAELMVRVDASIEAATVATRRMFELRPDVTALFVYNDFMAVGVLSTLLEMGLRVPNDIAIVGFDDIVYAPYLRVPLTTVSQQTDAIGQTAAQLLIARMEDPSRAPQRIVLEPHLVVRASTVGGASPTMGDHPWESTG